MSFSQHLQDAKEIARAKAIISLYESELDNVANVVCNALGYDLMVPGMHHAYSIEIVKELAEEYKKLRKHMDLIESSGRV